ncbi:MAG: RNA methyltransferase [Alphaproteobacteria bacterium]
MRGYFGIGVERLSKPMNAGNLFRSAHAFGAGFLFTVDAAYSQRGGQSDTSHAPDQMPFYAFDSAAEMQLPKDCKLVGVELLDEAVELPSFAHPVRAAYVFGPERGNLSDEMVERCDFTVKIPTSFCINVGVAGAIVMYDRTLNLGRFAERPVSTLAKPEPRPPHIHGGPVIRTKSD